MRVWKIVASLAVVLAVAVVGPVVDAWRHGGSALGLPLGISTAPGLPRPTVTVTAAPTDEPTAPPAEEPSTPPATRRPPTTPAVPPSSAGGRPPTHDARGRPILYLTFDDGPDPTWTPAVLRLLATHRAQATFFQVGQEVTRFPALARSVRAQGHLIGNHTYTHPWLTGKQAAVVASELADTDAALGLSTRCVRPPGGFVDAKVTLVASRLGKSVAMWDDDTKDWARPGTPAVVASILRDAGPGKIVLLHDGGGERSQSVAALGQVLPVLAARGYVFRGLPDC